MTERNVCYKLAQKFYFIACTAVKQNELFHICFSVMFYFILSHMSKRLNLLIHTHTL